MRYSCNGCKVTRLELYRQLYLFTWEELYLILKRDGAKWTWEHEQWSCSFKLISYVTFLTKSPSLFPYSDFMPLGDVTVERREFCLNVWTNNCMILILNWAKNLLAFSLSPVLPFGPMYIFLSNLQFQTIEMNAFYLFSLRSVYHHYHHHLLPFEEANLLLNKRMPLLNIAVTSCNLKFYYNERDIWIILDRDDTCIACKFPQFFVCFRSFDVVTDMLGFCSNRNRTACIFFCSNKISFNRLFCCDCSLKFPNKKLLIYDLASYNLSTCTNQYGK